MLVDLAYVSQAPVGAMIRDQMVDVTVRVRQVRKYAVQLAMKLLADETFVGAEDAVDREGVGCQEVLWAAAWICGEFSGLVRVSLLMAFVWPAEYGRLENVRIRERLFQHYFSLQLLLWHLKLSPNTS